MHSAHGVEYTKGGGSGVSVLGLGYWIRGFGFGRIICFAKHESGIWDLGFGFRGLWFRVSHTGSRGCGIEQVQGRVMSDRRLDHGLDQPPRERMELGLGVGLKSSRG